MPTHPAKRGLLLVCKPSPAAADGCNNSLSTGPKLVTAWQPAMAGKGCCCHMAAAVAAAVVDKGFLRFIGVGACACGLTVGWLLPGSCTRGWPSTGVLQHVPKQRQRQAVDVQ